LEIEEEGGVAADYVTMAGEKETYERELARSGRSTGRCSSAQPSRPSLPLHHQSRTAHAGFFLDALEQALHDRRPSHGGGLVHHSDSQKMITSSRAVCLKYRSTAW